MTGKITVLVKNVYSGRDRKIPLDIQSQQNAVFAAAEKHVIDNNLLESGEFITQISIISLDFNVGGGK